MSDKKKALIVQGGWDGHEPELVSARFKRILDEIPINCMIINDISKSEVYIKKLGFEKYNIVEDKKSLVKYHIY
ncbi:MAG: hypothetical protein IIX84_05185, partial [Oscillospiraceae bacterium]|nr:hypothetical protein [Oscillospiraceae bacterium]